MSNAERDAEKRRNSIFEIRSARPSASTAVPGGRLRDASEVAALERRAELFALKRKAERHSLPGLSKVAEPPPPPVSQTNASPEAMSDEEMKHFIDTLIERREERRHQLSIVKDFLDDPLRYGIQAQRIPSSSTAEEIAARRKEIQYRVDLLRTLLELSESEIQMLDMADLPDDDEQADAVKH